MVGTHSVWVYPDPAAGGWSVPLASNPYMTTDLVGWKAIPFGSGWVWQSGAAVSTNPSSAYQALGRDPAYPVNRPAGVKRWRVRADVSIPNPVRVFLLCRFGRTPTDAFSTAVGPNAASLFTWWDLPAGNHRLEAQFAPTTQPDPAFIYLSPQVTVQPTSGPVSISTLELTYAGSTGVDISCLVDGVSIHHGRDDSESQPEASSCTVDLTSEPVMPLPLEVDIGAVLAVTTQTEGASSQRFTGRITDMTLGWDDAGEATPDSGVGQLVAASALADLGRRVVGAVPFPQELDGARVSRVMTAAGITLDPTYSDPGTVQILARDVDSQPALDVAHQAAVDASGVLWQTRSGELRYADADHRRGIPVTMTLDACDILVTPSWRRSIEGLVNSVSVGYGPEPVGGGEQPRFTEASPTSQAKWGSYSYTSATTLAALADAQAIGRLLLARNSQPVWIMAALPVDVAGLDQGDYEALLALDMHSLVVLTGLPAIGAAPTSATLWVEGWRETLAYGIHELELVVSGYCRTAPPPRWDDLSPSLLWGGDTLSETRRNLVTNPSFELDTAGWQTWGAGTTMARQAGTAPQGAAYLRCTCNDQANTGAAWAQPGTPGTTYGLSAMTRLNSALGVGVRLQFLDGDGAQIGITSGTTTTFPVSTWGQSTVAAVAPAGTVTVRAIVNRRVAGAAGELLDIDAVLLMGYTTGTFDPTYFDGSTPDTSLVDYKWAGTAHASESVQSTITGYVDGLPPITWDEAACLGPPSNLGRWNDQPATLRWDQVAPAKTWNNYSA